MRKSVKRAALIAATGAMLAGTAFSANAASIGNGQWCQEPTGWWYKLTEEGKPGEFVANTWYWIKDYDGVVRCYYFDQNGWLQTDKTIDGSTLDSNGRWVVNGKVQEAGESQEYATSVDFTALRQAEEAKQKTEAQAASSNTASSGTTAATGKSKTYKTPVAGKGDNPANATFTQGYTNSTVSGSTVTNSWANFSMTLAGAKIETSGDGTDVYIDSDTTSNIYITYYPIGKYGTATLDGFVKGFLADARGYKGGTQSSDITLGAYSFKQLTKTIATPEGNSYDHAYIRVIDGTDYVMVITVEKNGNSEDYLSALQTMAKVR